MKLCLSLLLLLWGTALCAALPIGEVLKIHGEVLRQAQTATMSENLKEKDSLFEGDQLKTGANSFLRIKLLDDTFINLGPKSKFVFEKIGIDENKRNNLYLLTIGQLRAHVQKKAKAGEKIIFKAGDIPLGVRGTEFLSSVYGEEKLTTDALVLSGRIDAGGTELNPGQVYNSAKGIWKTLSPDELKTLQDAGDTFIPDSLIKAGLSALGSLSGVLASNITQLEAPSSTQTATMTIVEKHIVEVVKVKELELPWDIKEALKNREKLKAQNKCYFWEYKILPGSYVPQRFRRERDCDDYQEGR